MRTGSIRATHRSDAKERSYAKKIAEVVLESGLEDVFADCPHTRPGDIMIWSQHAQAKKAAKAEFTAKRYGSHPSDGGAARRIPP